MPLPDLTDGKTLVRRRHSEWRDRATRWTWLLDSYEGGDVYRWASYGEGRNGWPLRNLVRHPREYPTPGQPGSPASIPDEFAGTMSGTFLSGRLSNDGRLAHAGAGEPKGDDYWLRWHRTPPPTFVQEAVDFQLSRIYGQEPRRDGPRALLDWMEDVDGAGTSIKRWMREELAPRLLVLGCVDVLADRPGLAPGEELPEVPTEADRERLRLDRVEVRLIDPQDVLDWELDRRREYTWVLNREYHPRESPDERTPGTTYIPRYRYWDRARWVLLDGDGEVIDEAEHGLGVVPQRRLFTRRAPRQTHVGVSLFEDTAELAREYYNRDSELVLDDANHSHPQLQGDADAIEGGETTIGPGWMLPIRKDAMGNYIPYSVLEFPHGGAESIRANKDVMRSDADRLNGLAKPAGATGAGPVAQSGVSKSFDERRANDLLSRRSDILADAETAVARLVLAVDADGSPSPADLDAVEIAYTKAFDLLDAETMVARWVEATEALQSARAVDLVEGGVKLYGATVRDLFPGLADAEYAELEREARAYLESEDAPMPGPPVAAGMVPAMTPDDDATDGTGPGVATEDPEDDQPDEPPPAA